MSSPQIIESVTPCSGQYSWKKDLRLNVWLAVAVATYLIDLALLKFNPGGTPLGRGLCALAPIVPGLLYIRSWVQFIRGMDELQRRVQVEASLFAALSTVVVGAIIATLNGHGVSVLGARHGLGIGGAFMVLFPLWLVGWAFANRRFK